MAAENDSRLVLLDATSGNIIEDLGEGVLPNWSPDGKILAFYSHRSGEEQLWLWEGSQKLRQLTSIAKGIDSDPMTRVQGMAVDSMRYSWSPDGHQLVFASRVDFSRPAKIGPLVLTNVTAADETSSGIYALPGLSDSEIALEDGRTWANRSVNPLVNRLNELFVVRVDDGMTKQVTHDPRQYFSPVWLADNVTILASAITAKRVASGDRGAFFQLSGGKGEPLTDIVEVNTLNNVVGVRIDSAGAARFLQVSPNGFYLAYISSESMLGKPHLEVLDLRSMKSVNLGWHGSLYSFRWRQDSQSLNVIPSDHKPGNLVTIRLGGESTILLDAGCSLQECVQDVQGNSFWIQEHVVYKKQAKRESTGKLFSFRSDELLLASSEEAHWRNSYGEELYGELLYPLGYVLGKRYPLIVDAYPLSHSKNWMDSMGGNQTWAAAGYMVFRPAERAPHTWMNAADAKVRESSKGPEGYIRGLDDMLTGLDALDKRGLIDPARVCLYGHSNGGGAVSYFVGASDRFRCAIVVSPALADWVGWTTFRTDGRRLVKEFSGGYDFDTDISSFVAMSPVFSLYKSKTPMLIAAGDNDGEFLLGAIEVYNAVRSAGVDVTLVRYPDQGHLFTGAAMADFWQRQMSFFDRFLKSPDASPENTPPASKEVAGRPGSRSQVDHIRAAPPY